MDTKTDELLEVIENELAVNSWRTLSGMPVENAINMMNEYERCYAIENERWEKLQMDNSLKIL